jgi:GAF domain-containing protein
LVCFPTVSDAADPVPLMLEGLRMALGVGRCTLRQARDDAYFPVTHEVRAPGAPAIADDRSVDLRNQPVPRRLARGERQVVQEDCRAASADPAFHAMLERYGGMRAQVVTGIRDDAGELVAILSVHELRAPRTWTQHELSRIDSAARELAAAIA